MAGAASALPEAQLKLNFCHLTHELLCFHGNWGKKVQIAQGANGSADSPRRREPVVLAVLSCRQESVVTGKGWSSRAVRWLQLTC